MVGVGVFGYPPGHGVPHLGGHHGGTMAPGLVGHRVDVAIITREIAPLMDLEDEVPERRRAPALRVQIREVEQLVRPWRGAMCGQRRCRHGEWFPSVPRDVLRGT